MFVDISETTSVLLVHINNIRTEAEGYEMNVTKHSVHRINDEVFIFTSIIMFTWKYRFVLVVSSSIY